MKELKIYLEIMGLAEDENGNPDAAGLSIGGNMVPEDEYEEKMEEIRQKVTIKDVLWFTGLGMFVEEKDCRFNFSGGIRGKIWGGCIEHFREVKKKAKGI